MLNIDKAQQELDAYFEEHGITDHYDRAQLVSWRILKAASEYDAGFGSWDEALSTLIVCKPYNETQATYDTAEFIIDIAHERGETHEISDVDAFDAYTAAIERGCDTCAKDGSFGFDCDQCMMEN